MLKNIRNKIGVINRKKALLLMLLPREIALFFIIASSEKLGDTMSGGAIFYGNKN